MQHSAEVRWFFRGKLPKNCELWFLNGEEAETKPKPRKDSYLLFPGCESVGVKRRGQESDQKPKFEIKTIKEAPEIINYPSGITGRSDCWVKWSFGNEPTGEWIKALEQDTHTWITLSKTRWLRKFLIDNGKVKEVKERIPDECEGCNIELTEIEITNQQNIWWSFSFETFGTQKQLRNNLHIITEYFFTKYKNPPGHNLHITNSYSYPVWLAGMRVFQTNFKI